MSDPELDRIKALKMAQMRNGLEQKDAKIKVQVYSTPTCPYCHMAKEYLKQKGVEFEDIDVSKDQQAAQYMMSQTRQTGVPQLNIGGTWIIGFNREKIDALLSL